MDEYIGSLEDLEALSRYDTGRAFLQVHITGISPKELTLAVGPRQQREGQLLL